MEQKFRDAVNKYVDAIKSDYVDYITRNYPKNAEYSIQHWFDGVHFIVGRNYVKVVVSGGAHSFIAIEDNGKFHKGDILKASSWSAPAKNAIRGNIYGSYKTSWTGAPYLV